MTALYEEDLDLYDPVEVHWNASTILAIFFAASLISAVFFGLGYSFGGADTSKHSVAVTSADTSSNLTGSVTLQSPSTHAAAFSKPAVIANAARIVGTGLCVQYWNPDKAVGFFHEFSGWLMFIVSLTCLYLLHSMMRLKIFASRKIN